jgi:hypothetical protein
VRVGTFLALAAATRPEGALFAALLVIHRLVALRGRIRSAREWRWVAVLLALFLPYWIWRWTYYGWPLPNTYYAKAGGSVLWASGAHDVGSWAILHAPWWAAAAIDWGLRRASGSTTLRTLPWLAIVVMTLVVLWIGGDFMALHRFLVPVLPCLSSLAVSGLRAGSMALRTAGVSRAPLFAFGVALAALWGLQIVLQERSTLQVHRTAGIDSIGLLRTFSRQWTTIGRWAAINAPSGTKIATTAAGAIPYYSRLYTLDMLGLADEWIAHHMRTTGTEPGHTKVAPGEYVKERGITWVIEHPVISPQPPRPRQDDLQYWDALGYGWRTELVPGLAPPWWGFWQRAAPSGR